MQSSAPTLVALATLQQSPVSRQKTLGSGTPPEPKARRRAGRATAFRERAGGRGPAVNFSALASARGCSSGTMLSGARGWLASALRQVRAPVAGRCLHGSRRRLRPDGSQQAQAPPRDFDPGLLEFLVCPLSKKPLRSDPARAGRRRPAPVAPLPAARASGRLLAAQARP